jgi:tetratricopeptide (TPR) repeat protein
LPLTTHLDRGTALTRPHGRVARQYLAAALISLATPACSPAPPEVIVGKILAEEPDVARLVNEHVRRVQANPFRAVAHASLGLVYEANGMWSEAARCFENAAGLAEEKGSFLYHQSLCLGQAGDAEGELSLLQAAVAAGAIEPAPYYSLGLLLLRDGELDSAQEAFERALLLDSRQPQPKIGQAQVALARGRHEDARVLAEGVVAHFPEYRHASFVLGSALLGLGRTEEANRNLRRGLDSAPERMQDRLTPEREGYRLNYADRITRGVTLVDQKKYAEAIGVLESLLALRPDDPRALNNLGVAYLEVGRVEEAVKRLEHLIALRPEELSARVNLAIALRGLGRLEESLACAEQALVVAPEHTLASFARAETLMAMQRLPETWDALKRVVSLDPAFAPGQFALGSLALRMQEYRLAAESLTVALSIEPERIPAVVALAEALIHLGRFEEAEIRVRDAERLAPGHSRVEQLREMLRTAKR